MVKTLAQIKADIEASKTQFVSIYQLNNALHQLVDEEPNCCVDAMTNLVHYMKDKAIALDIAFEE